MFVAFLALVRSDCVLSGRRRGIKSGRSVWRWSRENRRKPGYLPVPGMLVPSSSARTVGRVGEPACRAMSPGCPAVVCSLRYDGALPVSARFANRRPAECYGGRRLFIFIVVLFSIIVFSLLLKLII